MQINDLIPPERYHEFMHRIESAEEHDERVKRISESYGPAISTCLRIHGAAFDSADHEYAVILTTLAIIDGALFAISKEKVQ